MVWSVLTVGLDEYWMNGESPVVRRMVKNDEAALTVRIPVMNGEARIPNLGIITDKSWKLKIASNARDICESCGRLRREH